MKGSRGRKLGVVLLAALAVGGAMLLVARGGSDPSSEARHSPADAGRPVEKAIWGPVEMPDGESAFATYERLGVDVYQAQLRWASIAPRPPSDPRDPTDPAYDWPAVIDRAVLLAPRHRIDVALMITTAPAWANGGRAQIRAPEEAADFADFAIAAARRYPQVRRWMIWGEPNRSDRFLPNRVRDPSGPRRYAELLDAAYEGLKSVSDRNIVIGGMTFTGGDVRPPDFLRWMRLPSGRPPRLDWYGHTPYPYRLPNLSNDPLSGGWRDISDVDTLGEEVDAVYRRLDRNPLLWLSEFTIQNGHDSRYFAYHVSAGEQAVWLKRGYAAAEEAGNVAGVGWFSLLDQAAGPESGNWGLMTADGSPKPAFRAYASILGR